MPILALPPDVEASLLAQGCAEVRCAQSGQELMIVSKASLDTFIMALSDEGFKQSALSSLSALQTGNTESIDVENDELFQF